MSRHGRRNRKTIRKIAAALTLILTLSDIPVMPAAAAPAQGTEENVTVPGEGENENEGETGESGTGSGSESGDGSGSGSGEGGTGNESETGEGGTGSGSGTGESGTGDGSEAGEGETGSEGENGESETGEEGEDTGDSEDEETDESETETPEDEEIEESDPEEDIKGTKKLQSEDEDLLTEEEIAAQKALEPKNLPIMEVFELPEHYVPVDGYGNQIMSEGETLPSEFDSRDSGILSSVKNQNPWGTCWAFSAIGILESSLIQQGIASRNSIDLSERHLAYFTYHTGYDRLGNASGDTVTTSSDSYYLENGGNAYYAAMRLMNWQGAAAESSYPYSNSSQLPADLDTDSGQDDAYHMRNCYFLDTKVNDAETIRNVKTLVKQYGCVEWSYYHSDSYYNYNTKAYYNNSVNSTNHAIVIVGWDDSYSKDNFKTAPEKDGAWIVRNSWGSSWGEDGYFYISYEDISLGAGNGASVMIADTADNYDNNYFNSNTCYYNYSGYYGKAAQVYQVKGLSAGKEELKAVSFMLGSTNTDYEIQIYKNPELIDGVVKDPESGTAMLESRVTGSTSYAGVYTVELPDPVTFEADDYMAVVIYFPNRDGLIYIDTSGQRGELSYSNETKAGESFYSSYSYTTSGNWIDLNNSSRSFRINLLTNNVDDGTTVDRPVVTATVDQPTGFTDTYKISLRWNRCTNTSGYEIYRSTSENDGYECIGSTEETKRQYQDEIARADYAEKYYYVVRAKFRDGGNGDSEVVTVPLEKSIGFEGFQLSFDGKTAELTWNAVEGASGYEIQRKEEADAEYTELATINDASVTSYSDDLSGESIGCYLYRIRAFDASHEYTAWSQEETAAMDLKIVQVDHETLKFSWPPKANADYYYIWITLGSTNYGNTIDAPDATVNIKELIEWFQRFFPSHGISDFRVGDTYSYYITAKDSSDAEIYRSNRVSIRTVPDALKIDSLEYTEDDVVKLTWNGGGGADTVEIYRSENSEQRGEVYASVPITDGFYTDSNVTRGQTYYYWICPTVQNSSGKTVPGEISGYKSIRVPLLAQNTELQSVRALSDTEVKLSWQKNTQAEGYYLYRSDTKGETGTILADITDADTLSYTDTGLTAGNIYYYSIAAYMEENDEKSIGKVSAQKGVRTFPAGTEIGESVTQSDTGAHITWKKAAGADGYVIERHMAGGSYEQLADLSDGNTISYEDTTVLSGHTYTYRIKAYNMALDSSRQYGQTSDEKQIAVTVGAVSNLTAYYRDKSAVITWDKVAGAKAYNIYVKQNDGVYQKLDTATESSYVWGGAKAGNTYTFKVVAVTQADTESAQDKTCELILYPNIVTISMVTAVDEDAMCITWNAEEGVTYDIYRSEKPAEDFALLQGDYTENSYEDKGIITGKTYYYKVIAKQNGLQSKLSETAVKSGFTRPNQAVLAKAAGYDSITIQNNPNYEYAIGTVYGDIAGRSFISGEEATITFDGLSQNSKYYIAVRTKKAITQEEPVYGAELSVSTNVKAQLTISPANVVLSKGNRVSITATVTPGNIHYPELAWTAENKEGNAYTTELSGDTVIVKGSDGKEILRIADGKLYAVGESEDKEVYLTAAKGTMEARIKVRINVPVTGLSILVLEDEEVQPKNPEALQTGDQVVVGAKYLPEGNADDTTVYWTTSNARVATVEERDSSSITVTAKGVGDCILKAYTADGVSTEKRISVKKAENIYEIWIAESDRDLDRLQVTKDENGHFSADGLDAKPVYELRTAEGVADPEEAFPTTITLQAWLLTESGIQKDGDNITGGTLQKAGESEILYRSANPSVATVDAQGTVTVVGAGETDLYACDPKGNTAYGSCHIIVSGSKEPVEAGTDYPIDKGLKLSAVTAKLNLQTYANDSQGSFRLQIKDQYGTLHDADKFTFVSANPSACMVDEAGVVTPNPDFAPKKNTSVKITASLKGDRAKRKVTFTVTILAADQIDRLVIEKVAEDGTKEEAEDILNRRFEKGDTITFAAKAYDAAQRQIDSPAAKFSVSDTSVATVKVNKDKTVTLTMKKAGRVNLICTAQDDYKRTASIQIAAFSTIPVISTGQINLNKMTAKQGTGYRSDSFLVTASNGFERSKPEITAVKAGKKELTQDTGLENFRVVENGDNSFSILIDDTDGFAGTIKANTVYTLEMQTEISGVPEIGSTTEIFTMKVKVISKEPAVKVTVPVINRFFVREEDATGLLVINAPDTVTAVNVLEGTDQINEFDRYFTAEKKNGQWYLKFKDDTGSYNKTSIKGKIAFTVDGYEPVVQTVTVKTPVTKQAVKQQAVPSIHTAVSEKAEIVLYNNTKKETMNSLRIVGVDSKTLNVSAENNGTLQASIKEGMSYKNGATLTATVKVMETESEEDCWKEPVSIKISVKAFSSKNPTVSMKSATLSLNRQTPQEVVKTAFTLNYQNVKLKDISEWQLYAYNSKTRKYDLQGEATEWLVLSYDRDTKTLAVGFRDGQPGAVAGGSYKFRISGFAEDFDALYKDFTVKVIDTKPAVTVKVSGKLDLVNRSAVTLSGKVTVKNSPSAVKTVTILGEDGITEHPYYRATEVNNGTFKILLTEEGMKASLTTAKTVLPIRVELENDTEIVNPAGISFKPVQTTPKVTVPATQTIYKSVDNLTRDYDMTQKLAEGIQIKKIVVDKAPQGFGVIAREGHVLVTLSDRGLKAGSYKVNVKIYFEGQEAVKGDEDGKPLVKTISVKVTE